VNGLHHALLLSGLALLGAAALVLMLTVGERHAGANTHRARAESRPGSSGR
jgi:hypothetical protein